MYSECYQKSKARSNPGANPSIENANLLARYTGAIFVAVINHHVIGIKDHSMRWNPSLTLPRYPRT